MNVNQVLELGSHGEETLELEKVLHNKGYLIRQHVDGFYNIHTEKSVRKYQSDNNLLVDGRSGPITLASLFPVETNKEATKRLATNDKLRAAFIETAYKYLGHAEVKTNSSPFIDKWLLEVGVDFPAAWCMAYVQGTGKEACKNLGIKDLLKPDTGGVLDFWNRTKSEQIGRLHGKRGDILIMDYGKGRGHTGWVLSYSGGVYSVLEGNTSLDGSRDGDGVSINNRKYSDTRIKGFIRIATEDEVKIYG